uniref:DUF4283 domain-containing protein n=1 Tax=Cannabis sativa TaxID=3483 RepID=A0A803PQ53_CANSA
MEPNLVNATPDAALDEVVNLVENVDVNDFSLDLTLDDDATKALIHRSVVENNALKIFEMGPWSPCGGFLLLTMMPFHGKWASADLNHVRIWVRVLGVPYRFYSNENIKKLANRVGTFITANKIRINGVTRNNFLRFQVNLNFSNPLLVGAGLDDENGNIPLYGLWLKHVLRLENGFAVLAAEDYKDRIHMENESVSDAIPYENSVSGTQAPMATVKRTNALIHLGKSPFHLLEKAHSTKAQLEAQYSGGSGLPSTLPSVERGETGPNEGTPMVDECEFQELARNYNKKRKLDKPESLLALEQDDGGKPYHAPQYLMKALSWNCWGLGQSCDVKALRGLVGLEVEIISLDFFMFVVKFTNVLPVPVWFGVFVYATPSRGDCKEFWENMALEDRCLKPFRFLDAWTRDPDCMEVVRNVAEPFDLTPPKRASMRNYSDVSIRGSKAFVATLVVDLEGVVVATHMNKFDISSPLEAEAFWFTNGSGVLQEIGLE